MRLLQQLAKILRIVCVFRLGYHKYNREIPPFRGRTPLDSHYVFRIALYICSGISHYRAYRFFWQSKLITWMGDKQPGHASIRRNASDRSGFTHVLHHRALSLFIQLVVHRLYFINYERTWNIFGLALVILSVQNMIVSSIALADYSCRSLAFIWIL